MLEDWVELSSFVALFHYLKGVTKDVLIRVMDFLIFFIVSNLGKYTFPFPLSPAKLKVLLKRQCASNISLYDAHCIGSKASVPEAYLSAKNEKGEVDKTVRSGNGNMLFSRWPPALKIHNI
jgi:hypothetical protein